jgi:multidrug resistance efflux pump
VKSLRKNKRVDNLQNEVRNTGHEIGRYVYISILVILFIWIADTFFGDYFIFRAEGLVLKERHTAAVGYTADVKEVFVVEGQRIKKGAPVVRVSSVQILEQITNLSIKLADLEAQQLELKSQSQINVKLLPYAQKRAGDMQKLRKIEEKAIKDGLASSRALSDMLEDEYNSLMQLEKLKTEKKTLQLQLDGITGIIYSLQYTLNEVEANYGKGLIKAPEDAIVSKVSVNPGSVIRTGDTMAQMLSGKSYILAYIQPGALYQVEEGKEVSIFYGVNDLEGTIDEIYPVSAQLPAEFQRNFRPRDRSQIVRIEITPDYGVIPATYTKVRVVAAGKFWNWLESFLN